MRQKPVTYASPRHFPLDMAKANDAMTPEQALATVASVRNYRERLTGRAAGLVWMVWGFALALLASTDMLALTEGTMTTTEGWGARGDSAALATTVVAVSCLLAGALVTNAVWKAHALERGEHHRSWVTWAGVAGLVIAGMLAGLAIIEVLSRRAAEDAADWNYVIIMPLVGAMAAGLIALLQRRRVSAWPGTCVAVLLLAIQFILPLSNDIAREQELVVNIQLSTFAILITFLATGFWYYKRG